MVELGNRSSSGVGTTLVSMMMEVGARVAGAPYISNEDLSLFLEFFSKTSL